MSNSTFSKTCIGLGALSAMLAVIAGAFGAHALQETLTPTMLNTYQTAAEYQIIHSIGLILIGILHQQTPRSCLTKSAGFNGLGIILFSGSLYILSLTGVKWLGMITPLGGVCFIVSWLLIAICYLRNDTH